MSKSHSLCYHAATSTERAKCRKIRSQARADVQALVDSYFDGTGEVADIATDLDRISRYAQSAKLTAAVMGYYDESLDVEEFICAAQSAVHEI